jgi:hypothetical protein
MKAGSAKIRLKRDLRRLFRSMDFIADRYLRGRAATGKTAERFFTIYQQLAVAWEFLGLQCRHWDGYRKVREGKEACRICGKIKGTDEHWLLLPRAGRKRIGRCVFPVSTSKKIFPAKNDAVIVADTVNFHGTKLTVEVQNAYKRRWPGGGRDITIAADRMIRLREGEVECWLDSNLVHVRWRPELRAKHGLPYSAFPWELPKAMLKNFPILLEHNARNRFVGVTILKSPRAEKQRQLRRLRARKRQ